MPKLVISLPDAGEVIHELTSPQITLGRVEDNTIQINDPSVSSHHARLVRTDHGYELTDLGSTNGTQYKGEPLEEGRTVSLSVGDRIQFGKVEAIYESAKKKDALPLPQEEASLATPAASSSRPRDFSNASPFGAKREAKDPVSLVAIILTVVGIVAAGVVALSTSQLQLPTL